MKNTSTLLLFLCMAMNLISCAQMKKNWIDSNCNKEEAYANGMNEARARRPMNIQIYNTNCPADNKPAILESYRTGYENGLKVLEATPPPTTIVIQGATHEYDHHSDYKCFTDFYGTHFEGLGENEEEARQRARERFHNEVCVRNETSITAKTIFNKCADHGSMDGFFKIKTTCVRLH